VAQGYARERNLIMAMMKLRVLLSEKGLNMSWYSLIKYKFDERGSVPCGVKDFCCYRADRLWVPSSLLTNGYRDLLPRDKLARA